METFLQLETSWIKPSDQEDGWAYQFIMTFDQSINLNEDMRGVEAWCEEHLASGGWKRVRVYIMVKTEHDAFQFKMRYC